MGQKHQLANLRLAAVRDAVLAVVDSDGVVKGEIGFLPGLHELEHLAPVMADEDTLKEVAGCELLLVAGSRNQAMAYPEGNIHSGADPNWKPKSPAEKEVRTIKRMVDGLKRERVQLRREMDEFREERERKKEQREAEKAAQLEEKSDEQEVESDENSQD